MAKVLDKTNPEVDIYETEAQEKVKQAAQKRMERCSAELQELLKKYKCSLHVRQLSIDGQNAPPEIFLNAD